MAKKHKDKDYNFGGWNGFDILPPKPCAICEDIFQPKSGAHKFCSEQCKGKWQYISGRVTTESQYKEISGNWNRYFSRLLISGGNKREALTVDILKEKLEEQESLCALSGIELTCKLEKGTRFLTNASIDRLEAGGPYIKENIQLVCQALNKWRCDTELKEFIWWCKKVAEFQNG